jgi:hypothetical protein
MAAPEISSFCKYFGVKLSRLEKSMEFRLEPGFALARVKPS